MKRVSLEEIETQYRIDNYKELYDKVLELIEQEKIKPVEASGKNGKKPALYKEYWILEKAEDNSLHREELLYSFVPLISTNYYLNHISQYKEDREWLLLLNQYLKNSRNDLEIPKSVNERSFAIWHREKFLKEEQGKKILKRCGLSMESLNVYETVEPLAYYSVTKDVPQNMLIIENNVVKSGTDYSDRNGEQGVINYIVNCNADLFCLKNSVCDTAYHTKGNDYSIPGNSNIGSRNCEGNAVDLKLTYSKTRE